MYKTILISASLLMTLLSSHSMAESYNCPAPKDWGWFIPAKPDPKDKNPTPKWTGTYNGSGIKWPNIEVKMRIDHVYNTRLMGMVTSTPIIPQLVLEDFHPKVKDLGNNSWEIICAYKLGTDAQRDQSIIQVNEAGLRTTSITVNHKTCTKGNAHHQASITCE